MMTRMRGHNSVGQLLLSQFREQLSTWIHQHDVRPLSRGALRRRGKVRHQRTQLHKVPLAVVASSVGGLEEGPMLGEGVVHVVGDVDRTIGEHPPCGWRAHPVKVREGTDDSCGGKQQNAKHPNGMAES
jgi:hypothetical protein